MNGSVHSVVFGRGFGWIYGDGGAGKYFFHRDDVDGALEFDDLKVGDRVSFDREDPPPPKGPRARHVRWFGSPNRPLELEVGQHHLSRGNHSQEETTDAIQTRTVEQDHQLAAAGEAAAGDTGGVGANVE